MSEIGKTKPQNRLLSCKHVKIQHMPLTYTNILSVLAKVSQKSMVSLDKTSNPGRNDVIWAT